MSEKPAPAPHGGAPARASGIDPSRHLGDILNHFDRMIFECVAFSDAVADAIRTQKLDAPQVLARHEKLVAEWISYVNFKDKLAQPEEVKGDGKPTS